jgi:Ca-activated chloride channel family protein
MRVTPFSLPCSARLAASLWAAMLALCASLGTEAASPSTTPSVTIAVPAEGAAAVGETLVEIVVTPANVEVRDVVILVDGFEVCRLEAPPWSCRWDAGQRVSEHHLRAVVTLPDGHRLVANRRTTSLDVDEAVRVLAVQVPVLVSNSQGRYERGLAPDQFTLLEDGHPQRIDTVFDDSLPLELVVAVDMSASMEGSMAEVRDAVKRFLARLRPGDTATVLGFNDTMFVLTDRESDPDLRAAAVEALLPWGGTALYDATVRAVELVREQTGRRGVVVFSDGDDLHSIMRREEALARIEEGQVVVYTVGFGRAGTDRYRDTLAAFAGASGGRAFFPTRSSELDDTFAQILDELSHQYVLSYVSNAAHEGGWRRLEVKARCEGCRVRAREGYRVSDP